VCIRRATADNIIEAKRTLTDNAPTPTLGPALTNRSLRAVVHVCDASAQIFEGVRGQFCKQSAASEPASSACRGLQVQEQAVSVRVPVRC
jgi:hypothetical protein